MAIAKSVKPFEGKAGRLFDNNLRTGCDLCIFLYLFVYSKHRDKDKA